MGATYRIDLALRMVFSTANEVLTDEDLLDHQARLRSDPDFDSSFSQLIDCTQVTELRVSSSGVRRVAKTKLFDATSRRAIVADQNQVFGMARMFELMNGGPEEIRVFRDMKEARRWLGLD